MATFSKQILSGSTNGRGILVAATSTPGTTIHATGTSATILDEIWLYAHNTSAATVKLTIEYGGTGTGDLIEFTVPAENGLYPIATGLILRGTGSAATTIAAFAATTNVLNLFGYVNRITP
jgi:hypothetical protein